MVKNCSFGFQKTSKIEKMAKIEKMVFPLQKGHKNAPKWPRFASQTYFWNVESNGANYKFISLSIPEISGPEAKIVKK